jgi:hypothetical protein
MVIPDSRCPNCGTPRLGEYCHACGQQAIDPHELRLFHHVRQAADELLHLDSKTLRSLAALLRPGKLTAEHLAGRRQPYLSPLKVYLLCAAIFFLAAPLAGFTLEAFMAQDRSGQFEQLAMARMKARGIDRPLFAERFDLRLQTSYTIGLGASVVATALFLLLLFRSREPRLGAHVVFALHYVSFLFLVAPVVGVSTRALDLSTLPSLAISYTIVAPYAFFALRRTYGESAGRTSWKTAVLLALTLVVDSVVNAGAFLLTLALV